MRRRTLVKPRYSINETAILLGIHRATLYKRIQDGELATQKDGRRTFITAAEILRYAAQDAGVNR